MADLLGVIGGVVGPFLVLILLVVPLIVVHELGHLLVARWRGIAVEEFGIGFPPRVAVLYHGRRTLLTLNVLPFGGFVRMAGATEGSDDPDGWERATLTSKTLVMLAGVLMNLLVAFALMVALAGPLAQRGEIKLEGVQPGSPAAQAGITASDRIAALNGTPFDRFENPLASIRSFAGEQVTLTVVAKSGERRDVSVRLRTIEEAVNQGVLGIQTGGITPAGPLERSLYEVAVVAARRTADASLAILNGLGELVTAPFQAEEDGPALAGPVGIAVGVAGAAEELGPVGLLQIAALLSANLAVLNLIPLPPLDGGRVAVFALRQLLGGERGRRAEHMLVTGGTFAILFLFVWITLGDVIGIVAGSAQ